MKKLFFTLTLLTGLFLTSCSKVTEVELTIADKQCPGDLTEYVALGGEKAMLNKTENGMQLQFSVDVLKDADILQIPELTLQVVDEAGNAIEDCGDFTINTAELFAALHEGKTGALAMTATSTTGNWKNVVDKAKGLKIADSKASIAYIIHMEGKVNGKHNMAFDLRIAGNEVQGTSFYGNPKNRMHNIGTLENGVLTLKDYTPSLYIGYFEGKFDGKSYKAIYTNEYKGGTTSDIDVVVCDGDTYVDDSDFVIPGESSYADNGGGSSNWKSFLDKYERYANSYVACCKKAQNGDPTALAEYMDMMQELKAMQEETESLGEPTSADLARYNNINAKIASAAQNL